MRSPLTGETPFEGNTLFHIPEFTISLRLTILIFEVDDTRSTLAKPRVPTIPHPEGLKYRVRTALLHLKDHCHQLSQATFRKPPFLKPDQIFRGQVHDRDPAWGVVLRSKFPEGHVSSPDLFQEIAHVLTIDLSELHRAISAQQSGS